jgi:GntR family transcriptional regulator, uxu operon transcriptional repressor
VLPLYKVATSLPPKKEGFMADRLSRSATAKLDGVSRRGKRSASSEAVSGTERSYLRLAEQIADLILHGEFKAGERLPSERNLAERFEISRTSVREAIIALEVQGLVEVRGGSGIYVCDAATKPVGFIADNGAGPFELLRARWVIESEVAALAAQNRNDGDIDRIYAQLVAMGRNFQQNVVNEADDRMFHVRLAEASGNSVMAQVVTAMWDQLRGVLWGKLEQHFHAPQLRAASLEDHQRIFDALVARDPVAARDAMRGHLERVMNEFKMAWR